MVVNEGVEPLAYPPYLLLCNRFTDGHREHRPNLSERIVGVEPTTACLEGKRSAN